MGSGRRLTRVALRAPVEFNLWHPSTTFFGFATNISEGGAFIETASPATPFREVAMRMWPWGEEELVVGGVVRWKGASGMGVQFLSVGSREVRGIHALVDDWGSPAASSPNDSRRTPRTL